MEHKLAKKLKNAGFPECRETYSFDYKESIPDPTLSELIEACGDGFNKLVNYNYTKKEIESLRKYGAYNGDWCAYGSPDSISKQGKTPKIVVAKLWLKLNT